MKEFISPKILTSEEKLDYIYNKIRREEKYERMRIISKIIFYICIFYFIFFYIPNMVDKKIKLMKESIPGVEFMQNSTSGIKDKWENMKNFLDL